MSSEYAEKPKDNTCTRQDAEADGESSNTNPDWIVAVNVECLSWPKHKDRKEIGARDKGNHKRQGKNPGFLLETRREHGMLGSFDFPDDEGNKEKDSEDQGNKDMGGFPGVLTRYQLLRQSTLPDNLPGSLPIAAHN